MTIILFHSRSGKLRSLRVSLTGLVLLTACVLLAAAWGAGYLGYQWRNDEVETQRRVLTGEMENWRSRLIDQRRRLQAIRAERETERDALIQRVALLQAHVTRLNALGGRVMEMTDFDAEEFDFTTAPPLGGPFETGETGPGFERAPLDDALSSLSDQMADQERQLAALADLLLDRRLSLETLPKGRPVEHGWISSKFGRRADPFTGKQAWHTGVDIAGKKGSEVLAVAAGVVTKAEDGKDGYGMMLEIDHGGGLKTRYGHTSERVVNVGDVVHRGEVIGRMGSSGRSTGPHVHFEVVRGGKTVDPARYLQAQR